MLRKFDVKGQSDSGSRLNDCSVVLVKLESQYLVEQPTVRSTNECKVEGEIGLGCLRGSENEVKPNNDSGIEPNDAHEIESQTGDSKKVSSKENAAKKKPKSDNDEDYKPNMGWHCKEGKYYKYPTKKKKKVKNKKVAKNTIVKLPSKKLSDSSPSATPKKVHKFVCTICGHKSANSHKFASHLRIHSTEKPLACSFCDFRTKENINLKRHMMNHTGVKPFQCDLCAKGFCTITNLRIHKQGFHGTEKKHSCQFCDFKGKTIYNVRAHVRRMHMTTATVYRCDKCGKRTMDETRHQNHMLAHQSNSWFHCHCGLKYVDKFEYEQHFKKTHGPGKKETKKSKKPEASVCRLCGRSYSIITGLKKHRDRHHPGELFHHCEICSFSTDLKNEFVRHLATLTHMEKLKNSSNAIDDSNAIANGLSEGQSFSE